MLRIKPPAVIVNRHIGQQLNIEIKIIILIILPVLNPASLGIIKRATIKALHKWTAYNAIFYFEIIRIHCL